MIDTSHLIALQERLSRANDRLAKAKTDSERNFRQMESDQAKREVDGELNFLGMPPLSAELSDISDDDLFAALNEQPTENKP